MGKITTSDIRNGLNIILDGNIYSVVEFLHVKPGKGGAFVRTKVKGVVNNKVLDRTFKTGETLESVRVERHPYQFLYNDGDFMHFMHVETYEQIMIGADKVAGSEFLKESGEVTIAINADENVILFAEVPNHVELLVVQTDPGVRGDTAQGASKPATLESGAVINVPLFINEGDVLRVDTRERSYIERVKNN
ncbi:MAG: elongation factor P [Bacteroidetes bacterium]|nr:elongation factor P [Bacteroidota bacterium]NCQ11798.1 elongation factor P [Bacteroidota bacterium]